MSVDDPSVTTPSAWAARWEQPTAAPVDIRTIDVHTHLLVPEAAELTKPHFKPEFEPRSFFSSRETTELNQQYHAAVREKFTTPQQRLSDMDAMGIDVQVVGISPFQYYYWADDSLAPRVASVLNQGIAEAVRSHPGRFVGIGTLPMGHPDAACAEARRIVDDYGFTGVELGTDVNGIDLDHERFEPLWDTFEELELVAVLHPAGFTQGERLTDYYLVNVIGMPLSSTVSVTRMILGGVFERHPRLQLLVVHGGGYLTFYAARTDHAFRHRPELRKHIDRPPSEYLRQVSFDTTVFDSDMVTNLVRNYGADHVVLGTDYPFDMGEPDPLKLIRDADLTDEDRALIFSGNAERLFRIER